jgi:hypothetical protein
MLMVCHHLDPAIAEDSAFAESRIHKETITLHLLKIMLKANGKQGVPQGGVVTPLTQKVTCVAWRLPTFGARGRPFS